MVGRRGDRIAACEQQPNPSKKMERIGDQVYNKNVYTWENVLTLPTR